MKQVIKLVVDDEGELPTIMEAMRSKILASRSPVFGDGPAEHQRGAVIAAICRDYLDSLRRPPAGQGEGRK